LQQATDIYMFFVNTTPCRPLPHWPTDKRKTYFF